MFMFRPLVADKIDCRISTIKDKDGKPTGLSLLLYKDARCDQNILDETVGPMNWQREHTRDNRNCIVSIWDATKEQWISKEDTGTESNTEKEKGLASDSFKRACFNWGIGRELYTAPFIWIPADKCEIKKGFNGKWACYDNFTVTDIQYDEKGNITFLRVKNARSNQLVFQWGNTQEKPQKPDNEPEKPVSQPDAKAVVTTANKIPQNQPKITTAKDYIANELVFMGEMFNIADKKQMLAEFAEMRKQLIADGIIEDVPADRLTMDEAKQLIDAIYKNFQPSGEKAS